MPIVFNKTDGWVIKKPTQEEQEALMTIGKKMVIEGLAGAYCKERYQNWLKETTLDKFFNA